MYTWQYLNSIIIQIQPTQILKQDEGLSLNKLCLTQLVVLTTASIPYVVINTSKAMMICYFNLLHKVTSNTSFPKLRLQQPETVNELCLILVKIIQINSKWPQQVELEWLNYILEIVSSKLMVENISFVSIIMSVSLKRNLWFEVLHCFDNYLELSLDERSTSSIIKGHDSPLPDVRDMYKMPVKTILFTISFEDYLFIQEIFVTYANSLTNQIQQRVKNVPSQQQPIKQLLIEVLHILNSVLFLGGYNPQLQQHFNDNHLMQLLRLLQISYVIHVQQYSTKSKHVNHSTVAHKSLLQLLCITDEISADKLCQILLQVHCIFYEPGQLNEIVRLLANLTHLNKKVIQVLQLNPKYVHIILTLTHQYEQQANLREWAIVFIKNVTESDIIRSQISNIKVTIDQSY